MTTKEMYEQGYRCRGIGFNCASCYLTSTCVEYQPPTKIVDVKNKKFKIKEEPIGKSIIVTNDKMSYFRAFKGQELGTTSKKYVAYIHEIVEEF